MQSCVFYEEERSSDPSMSLISYYYINFILSLAMRTKGRGPLPEISYYYVDINKVYCYNYLNRITEEVGNACSAELPEFVHIF